LNGPFHSPEEAPDIVAFIESLGLHDIIVTELLWLSTRKRFELAVDDLFGNFEGFPEYPGEKPGRFVIDGVSKLEFDVDMAEKGIMIYDWEFKDAVKTRYDFVISFFPCGEIIRRV